MTERQLIEAQIISLLGKPYYWGGDDPLQGMDCSGLIIFLLCSIGVLPWGTDMNSHAIYHYFKKKSISSIPIFGSIACFGSPKKITHVGFCVNHKQMVEAGGGSSDTITIMAAIKQNAFIKVSPINRRKDLVEIVTPRYEWI